jgi:hypothetical protein
LEPNSKTDIARTNRIKLTFRAARGRATGDGYEPAGRKLMTIIVGETERAALKAAMARARTHPTPWEVVKREITDHQETDTEPVEDRPPAPERPPSEYVDLPFGYVVAISFEEQPAGMCLHVSVSGPWPKVAPNMVVCAMIFNALNVPIEADHVWTEEFLIDGKLGGRVFNVVWLVEPVVGGIAGTL